MELPKVYANKINKKIDNTQSIFYGSDREVKKMDFVSIEKKINDIFKSINHVYKSKVEITTYEGIIVKDIVGKTGNYLLTLDGEKININNILDIERK